MRIAWGLVLLGLLVAPLGGQTPPKPSKGDVERWISQLGSDDFTEREEATRKLWEAGSIAEEAVQKATKSADAEVSRRAREVAEKFRWGIYPDTPKAIADAIGRFQQGDLNSKGEVVRELLDGGVPGCRAVIRIARQDLGAGIRPRVLDQVSEYLNRAIPDLLANKNTELLGELLELTLDNPTNSDAVANYVAFWLLSGKLDERIAHHKKLLAMGNTDKQGELILSLLYRAKGDYREAVAVAEKAGNEELVTTLLEESGDWKALNARGNKVVHGDEIETLGYRAAYARLAGDERNFNALIAELKSRVGENAPADDRPFQVAKALFLNGKTDEAMTLLEKGPYWVDRVQLLFGRMRYKEAAEVIEKARQAKVTDLPRLELLEARTLHAVGEKERAQKIFERYAKFISPDNDVSWLEDLVESEAKSGLREQAFDHAGKILAVSPDHGWPQRLMSKLFPGKGDQAVALWAYMQQRFAGQDRGVLLRQMRALIEGKTRGEALLALAKNAGDTIAQVPQVDKGQVTVALAEVLNAAGEEKAALELLEASKLARAGILIGDIHFERGRFAEAATAYLAAYEQDRSQPTPLYLAGLALEKAGKVAEGKARIEQSHWLSLGRDDRDDFVRELARRGLTEPLAREVDLLRRTTRPGDYYAGEAIRRQALAALERKEFALAASLHEQAMLRCLQSRINFVEKAAYIGVPAMIHGQRAAGLVQAGKFAEAVKEYDLAQTIAPGSIEGTIRMVRALDQAGRKADADAIFTRASGFHRSVLKDYPESATLSNSAAWLAANCKRGLEQARKDAERATSLDPESPGYLDTLAEVLFQLGEKEKAVEIQKRVVKMSPKRVYFKKQLARIEAGDRNADLPPEDDEEDE